MHRLLVLQDVAMNLPTCESVSCGGSRMSNSDLLRMMKGLLCVLLPYVAEVGTTWVPFLPSHPTHTVFSWWCLSVRSSLFITSNLPVSSGSDSDSQRSFSVSCFLRGCTLLSTLSVQGCRVAFRGYLTSYTALP